MKQFFARFLRALGPPQPEIDELVESVAVLVDDNPAFRERARVVAAQLGPSAIPLLERRYVPIVGSEPKGFGVEECGLSGWISYWQFAVFEVFYHFREAAIPALWRVLHDEYDWVQGNAIEILCRFASEGMRTEEILRRLASLIPTLRYEALLYAAGPLLEQAKKDEALAAIVRRLRQVDLFDEAVQELGA